MSIGTIAIFKPGKHKSSDGRVVEFSEANCRDLVESYDPALAEAPYVIGHPKQTAPAYGWAGQLHYEDGLVKSVSKQVNDDFAKAVTSGAYKKRSASIYLPDSPGNPKPGHYYLRHVGFLGAEPPAIKGLPEVNFSAHAGDNAFVEFSINESELHTEEPEMTIPSKDPAAVLAAREKELADKEKVLVEREKKLAARATADFSEREQALIEREKALAEKEAKEAEKERAAKKSDIAEFAEGLVKEGRIHPKSKNGIIEALFSIESLANEPVSFSESGATVQQNVGNIIRDALAHKTPFVDFSEKSGGNKGAAEEEMTPEEVAEKARQYQLEQKKLGRNISITAAVNHVKKEAGKS